MATATQLIHTLKHKIIREIVEVLNGKNGCPDATFTSTDIYELNAVNWFARCNANDTTDKIITEIANIIVGLFKGAPALNTWATGWSGAIQTALHHLQYDHLQGKHFLTEAVLAKIEEPVQTLLRVRGDDLSAAEQTSIQILNVWLKNPANYPINAANLNIQLQKLANTYPAEGQLLVGGVVPALPLTREQELQINLVAVTQGSGWQHLAQLQQILQPAKYATISAAVLTLTQAPINLTITQIIEGLVNSSDPHHAEISQAFAVANNAALQKELHTYQTTSQTVAQIYQALITSHPATATQLAINQREIMAYLTANPLANIATIVQALKTASDMFSLRTALRPLIGHNNYGTANWQDISLQPLLIETRWAFLLEKMKERPQLLVLVNANAEIIKDQLKIEFGAAPAVDVAAQVSILLSGESSFLQVKTALHALGLAKLANLDALVADRVTENVLLALTHEISPNNQAVVDFLHNPTIQGLIAKNIKKQATAQQTTDFLHSLVKPQLNMLQMKVKSKRAVEKAICILLGVDQVDATGEAEFINRAIHDIYYQAAIANYKPDALKVLQVHLPQLTKLLDKNLALKEKILAKTVYWTDEDWRLRTSFLIDALLQYTFTPRDYDAIRADPIIRKFFQHDILTAAHLSDGELDVMMGEARLNRWLVDKMPDFASLIKTVKLNVPGNNLPDTTAWAEIAENLGAIPDAVIAKQKLEDCLEKCWYAIQAVDLEEVLSGSELIAANYQMPVKLDYNQSKQLQAEIVLMHYEKLNPALVRWFRNNATLWARITQLLASLNFTNKMFNTLRGISYLLQHPSLQDPEFKRLVFTAPLNELLDTERTIAMFGGEIPAISLALDTSLLDAILSGEQLETLTQSAAAATALAILSNDDLRDEALFKENLDKITKRLQASRSSTGIFLKESLSGQLEKQALQDDELYRDLEPLIKQVKDIAQFTRKEEAFTACLHAAVAIDSVRRYFAEKLQNLRYQFEASENIVAQTPVEMSAFIVAEQTLQAELVTMIKRCAATLQTIDSHMEQINTIVGMQKAQVFIKYEKTLIPKNLSDETVVIETGEDVIAQIDQLKTNFAQKGRMTAYTGGVEAGQRENELMPGKQLLTVTNNITGASKPEEQYAFSRTIINTGNSFVASICEIPAGEGIVGWWTGATDARSKALDIWTDELLSMSDEDYNRGAAEKRLNAGTMFVDLADKALLKDVLVLLFAKNRLREFNGERVVSIKYDGQFENIKEIKKEIAKTFDAFKYPTPYAKKSLTKEITLLGEKTRKLEMASKQAELATGNRPGRSSH